MYSRFRPLVLGKIRPIHEAMEPIIRSLYSSHNLSTSLGEIAKPTLASLESLSSLKAIGNAIGKFYYRCPKTKEYARTTYARICVEMDFNARFPAEINITSKEYVWNQKLDYESVLF